MKKQLIYAILVTALGLVAGIPDVAEAAVRCRIRLGNGCNGPEVYRIEMCSGNSLNQAECVRRCENRVPICNITDYDPWLVAYYANGRGRYGQQGSLAESGIGDASDERGFLTYTAGNTYTVCASKKNFSPNWSNEYYVSSRTCVPIAPITAADCRGGTVFNPVPVPHCEASNSYCGGGGSTGDFYNTMSAGFQMVGVQNQHFVDTSGLDTNVNHYAATGGAIPPGIITPVPSSAGDGISGPTFQSSNANGRGSSARGASGMSGAGGLAALSGGTNGLDKKSGPEGSQLASTMLGTSDEYGAGSGSDGTGGKTGGLGGGPSWFGSGSGASATAGTSSGEVGFGKESDAASRGLASDGSLNVEDPANYFLLSDVDVSLFKRVTAQFRKKERSLVLAP